MPIATARLKAQKFACASIILTLTQLLLVFGTLGLTLTSEHNRVQDIIGLIFGLLSIGSAGLAIIGLFNDPEKGLSVFGLMFSLFGIGVCGFFFVV